jgi:fibro-slime domain-containing protein
VDPCGTDLTGRLRDFTTAHPDFEYVIAVDTGLVAADLGADGKPVYAGPAGGTVSTHGPAPFDQWYRDDPAVNTPLPLTLTLSDDGNGIYTYDNPAFFPLDGLGFGDQGLDHNFHFTFELHTKFLYQGGETFRFIGDDDLFAFINRKLVIDLGGVHGAMTGDVDLNASAASLGITPGQVYSLDVFFAERHTTESEFRIDTTLEFVDCGNNIPD